MYKTIKRFFDLAISGVALLILSPFLLLVTCFLFFINKGGGAFFTQERPGLNAKPFRVLKFKTMTDEKDSEGQLLSDEKRLTKVGKFIRTTSIDELPQLVNVLKGDMSFIGPRPLLLKYVPLYSEEQYRRHEVHPGITGWAQINGRNNIAWKSKFELDVYYVDNISFYLDLKIFFMTIWKIVKRADISKDGNVTTEAFNGYN